MGWGDLRPYFFTPCHGASAGEGLEGEAVWDRKPVWALSPPQTSALALPSWDAQAPHGLVFRNL